jgi:hypothetical protein
MRGNKKECRAAFDTLNSKYLLILSTRECAAAISMAATKKGGQGAVNEYYLSCGCSRCLRGGCKMREATAVYLFMIAINTSRRSRCL